MNDKNEKEELEALNLLIKLEFKFEEAFGREKAGKLYLKMWHRAKKEFKKDPGTMDALWRISIEEIFLLIIAHGARDRFETMKELMYKTIPEANLDFESFDEIEKYYENELKIFRAYLKERGEL